MRISRWSSLAAAVVVTVSLDAQAPHAGREPGGRAESATGSDTSATSASRSTRCRKTSRRWNDSVFSFGELGFQEFETSKYLTGILEAERLHDRRRASPAFRRRGWRRWGSGKPVIALGSDID